MTSLWNHDLLPLQWGAVLGASLAAAACDLAWRRIPNSLTGPFFLAGIVWALLAGGVAGLLDGLLGTLLCAVPFLLLFAIGGGGAGDAKLMGAVGMWLGVKNGAIALGSVAACGIVLAVACALAKRSVRPALANMAAISRSFMYVTIGKGKYSEGREMLPDVKDMQKIPYGLAIFAGMALATVGIFLWHSP